MREGSYPSMGGCVESAHERWGADEERTTCEAGAEWRCGCVYEGVGGSVKYPEVENWKKANSNHT